MADFEVNTFAEMRTTLQSDLTIDSMSSLFDPNTAGLSIARAYRKIAAMYQWPQTRDSKITSTVAGQEYYDYPTNWRPDSIWKLMVDGVDYGEPLAIKDYYSEQQNNYPSGLTILWSNENNRFLITNGALPPQTNGNNNMVVWGHKVVDPLVNDSDTTIFSFNMPELNEAIILEASAILKQKGEIMQVLRRLYISGSELLSFQSTSIVNAAWQKVMQQNAKYAKTIPMFQTPNLFPSGINRNQQAWNIGNFVNKQ
jgi:hypothetical protein